MIVSSGLDSRVSLLRVVCAYDVPLYLVVRELAFLKLENGDEVVRSCEKNDSRFHPTLDDVIIVELKTHCRRYGHMGRPQRLFIATHFCPWSQVAHQPAFPFVVGLYFTVRCNSSMNLSLPSFYLHLSTYTSNVW